MDETIRVNTRISIEMNQWLDEYSKQSGLSKSTLVHVALDNFIRDKEALKMMKSGKNLEGALEDALEKFELRLDRLEKSMGN
ncbi:MULTISPECIES: hypothetical protein [Streptomyces]|uniref:hypothetical protein n=1 Tax=Streptomyces TaxID=1883 RepID=UPI0035DB02B3